jgi:Heterokaryon incompatibility protein (HET)
LQLQRSNYHIFKLSIPYEELSRTFKDAIFAAHKLGFEYIWIDSLCIVQRDAEDWGKEAGTMKRVYVESSLNLAATFSKSSHGGLFRSRNPTSIVPCLAKWDGLEGYLIYDGELWPKAIEQSHLLSRAWVLQEVFLTLRTLYFGESQLFWECSEGFTCESQPWDPKSRMNRIATSLSCKTIQSPICMGRNHYKIYICLADLHLRQACRNFRSSAVLFTERTRRVRCWFMER